MNQALSCFTRAIVKRAGSGVSLPSLFRVKSLKPTMIIVVGLTTTTRNIGDASCAMFPVCRCRTAWWRQEPITSLGHAYSMRDAQLNIDIGRISEYGFT